MFNWDIYYVWLGFYVMGVFLKFIIKWEWMCFLFNLIIGLFGGLVIDCWLWGVFGEWLSYIQLMVELLEKYDKIVIMVILEGICVKCDKWKIGFYYVVFQAKVFICLGYFDYVKKEVGVGGMVYLFGDIEVDLKKIMDFYKDIFGKYLEQFVLDQWYI